MRTKLPDLIAEEAEWAKVPKDVPIVRSMRWALLHGAEVTADEAAERWDVATSVLSQVVAQLRQAGYNVEDTPEPIAGTGARRKRFRVTGKAARFTQSNSEKQPPAKRKRRVRSDPAPTPLRHPALGATLRVAMIAEDHGQAALVLVGDDGHRWPVIVQGDPL